VTRAKDSTVEPRLGASFDTFGNGRLRFNVSYSKYAAKIAETVGGSASAAGNPAYFYYRYRGPAINAPGCTPGTALCGVDSPTAFQAMYDWFTAAGGTAHLKPFAGSIPGIGTRIDASLKSPDVTEYTAGVGSQIGRGFVRVDLMDRSWGNFYAAVQDMTTGQATDQFGNVADITQIVTTDKGLERKCRAAPVQASYQFTERLQGGGNYTYAKLRGNGTAETSGSGPVSEGIYAYPEYKAFAQNNPIGYLPSDQRHKVRAWVTWGVPTRVGNFTFSALERFDSGTPYSAVIPLSGDELFNYIPAAAANSYAGAPSTINYYVNGQRGNYRWDDINALDLSVNYRLRLGRAELFVEPELLNAFNQAAVYRGNTTVVQTGAFNPLTGEAPKYRLGSKFGQPNSPDDYARMRTYRVSLGVRF